MSKISGIYVEIRGDSTQLKKDLSDARAHVVQQAKGISDALNNALSPAQLRYSLDKLVADFGTLSRASKLAGDEFQHLGVDLKELQRVTGLSDAQFQTFQSRMMQTRSAANQEKALKSVAQAVGMTREEIMSMATQMRVSTTSAQRVADSLHGVERAAKSTAAGTQSAASSMDVFASAGRVALGVIGAQTFLEAAFRVKEFAGAVVDAGIAFDALERSYAAIFGSQAAALQQFDQLRKTADETGQNFYTLADGFKNVAASARGTTLEGQGVQNLMHGMSSAATVLGLSNEKVQLSLKAFSDMLSKGTVQAEELKNQLGDNLPDALGIAARGMGMSRAALMALMKEGKVAADEVIPAMTAELERMYGEAAKTAALESGQAAVNKLSEAWTEFKTNLYNNDAFVVATRSVTDLINAMNRGLEGPTRQMQLLAQARDIQSKIKLISENPDGGTWTADKGFVPFASGDQEKTISRLKAQYLGIQAAMKEVAAPTADSWLTNSKLGGLADERAAGIIAENADAYAKGVEKMQKYIQTRTQAIEAERAEMLKFAKTPEEIAAVNAKADDELAALNKKSLPRAASAAATFANAVRDVNKEFAEIEGNQASVWLANWEDRFADLSEKIMKGTSGAERDAALARLKAADAATRQAIAAGYQTMVDAKQDLAEFKSTLAAMGADDPHTADIAKTNTLLSKLQNVGLISGQQAEEYRAKQSAVWAKEVADKNLETQRQFYSQYTQIAGDGFAVIEDGILKQAEVYKKAGVDQVAVARWVEDQKLQYATDWESGAKRALQEYAKSSKNMAQGVEEAVSSGFQGMEDALVEFVTTGKLEFSDLAESIIADLARIAIQQNITQPLASGLSNVIGNLFSGGWTSASTTDASILGNSGFGLAKGGVVDGGVHSWVNTVQASPKYFDASGFRPFAVGGVFGEAGPEAVMPLTRAADGSLGVRSTGGSGTVVNVYNNATGTQATTTERQENGVNIIDVLVEQVDNSLAAKHRNGQSTFGNMLTKQGLSRATGAYR